MQKSTPEKHGRLRRSRRPALYVGVVACALALLLMWPSSVSGQIQWYSGTDTAAAFGDYGCKWPDDNGIGHYKGNCYEEQVADKVVLPLDPRVILALGDNNYPLGATNSFDTNHQPYDSVFGKFKPAVGNHGYLCSDCPAEAHVSEFFLGGTPPPGNLKPYLYYTHDSGGNPPLVEYFVVDSDPADDDPNSGVREKARQIWTQFPTEQQGMLKDHLTNSDACWKIVYFHHPPYSGGTHGSNAEMQPSAQWYYDDWGADIVFSAHDHNYQRFEDHRLFPYVVSGAGGGPRYDPGNWPPAGTPPKGGWPKRRFQLNEWGASYIYASTQALVTVFYSVGSDVNEPDPTPVPVDVLYLVKYCNGPVIRVIDGVS